MIVDTDVWIDYFTGADPGASAVTRLLLEHRAAMSVITLFELFAGVRGKKRLDQIEALEAVARVLPLSPSAARLAGRFYTSLATQGALIGTEDLLIAGTAQDLDLAVVTRNVGHFRRIPELSVVHPEELLRDAG